MDNVIWEKENHRCIIQVVSTPNWKGGIPISKKIKKWLVKIIDKYLSDEYCPTDHELIYYVPNVFDIKSLELIIEAFEIKEKHNKKYLKNPEKREKERQYKTLVDAQKRKRGVS